MEKVISANFSDIFEPNVEIKEFPDGDSYVRVPHSKSLEGKDVRVYHRLYPNQNTSLLQALLLGRALKGARSVEFVAPYIPYSRQDKLWLEGEVKSAEVVMELLKFAGYSSVTTFDCHFLKKAGEFEYGGMKINNITLSGQLIGHAKARLGGDFEVISPDAGANYMSGGKGMRKVRGDYGKGNVVYRDIEKMEIDFDVGGKNILIIDDMISTGSTMARAIENLRKNGAGKIALAATHGFFLKDSLKKLGQLRDYILVSNTIPSSV
ncbi:Ribose-phosphate pyrophosphokinase [uncultured archaeon]|nr:Ribose-phosphate pyrophosphokinase [uncultured archaeon]